MSWWKRPRRRQKDADLVEELDAHLAMAVQDRIDRGERPEEAIAAAQREFGNRALVEETTRQMWGGQILQELSQDVRYALRGIKRSPGFTAVALVSLALGIGANTAMFSLLNTVMLRMLPVEQPGELVELIQRYPGEPLTNSCCPQKSYDYIRTHNHVFSSVFGMSVDNRALIKSAGSADAIGVSEIVTPNYFAALGIKPALGRLISEDRPGVAVLSWNEWQNRFQGDASAIGKKILVQGEPLIVVGIAPRGFTGLRIEAQTNLWSPMPDRPDMHFIVLARLNPGVTLPQAQAEMEVLTRATLDDRIRASKDPQVRLLKPQVLPAGSGLTTVRDRLGQPLIALMSLVALLLLVACVNIANMLLARATSREREMALRVSLGASRGRIFRQLLTESLVLSLLGTIAGVVVAYFLSARLVSLLASGRPHERIMLQIKPDVHVLLFTIAVSVLAALIFGIAPLVKAFHARQESGLKQQTRSGQTLLQRVFGRGLVVAQVALSLLLLSAGALFVGHLWKLEHIDLGFTSNRVLLVGFDAGKEQRVPSRYRMMLDRVRQIPGVQTASLAGPTPLSGAGASGYATAEGFQELSADRRWTSICYISPGYFHSLQIPLISGRDFNSFDEANWKVAIVSAAFARHYFAGRDPLGKHVSLEHVTLDPEVKTYQIIGIAGDANYYDIQEPQVHTIYLPAFRPNAVIADHLIVRTTVKPETVAPSVRAAFHDALNTTPILNITTLSAQKDASILLERLVATLAGAFAALGLLLATVGLYGLLAYTVARRTSEIGVRLVLGADRTSIVRMILSETIAILACGVMIGAPLAFIAIRLLRTVLPDTGSDIVAPVIIAASAALAGALIASYAPAHRAATVNPVEALRHE